MSVKLNNLTPNIRMNVNNASTVRQTVDSSFGAKLRNGLSATAKVVGGAANMASAAIPGGTIVSAALSGAGQAASSSAAALTANTAQAPVTNAGAAGGGSGLVNSLSQGGNIPGIGGTGNTQMDQAKQLMQQQAAMNVQFLQLQSSVSHESRSFQTLSNVMKTRHSAASNSIRNASS